MSKQMLDVRYQCLHPSCCANCREGVITVDEEAFVELCAFYPEEDVFRSPRGACRLGFNRAYKLVSVKRLDEGVNELHTEVVITAAQIRKRQNDPIALLMNEHQSILKLMARIEEQRARREVDALWASTREFENEIMLHSGLKEEEVLLPMLMSRLPLGEGLAVIIREEHREIVSILHAFRCALEDGDINDGVLGSVMMSLNSHIRKEDNEFFVLVDKHLTDDLRGELLEGMKKIEAGFVPVPPGERNIKTDEQKVAAAKRLQFHDDYLSIKEIANTGSCCGH
ncbi:MAG: hemerythrin domain-containing protein [Deltaproteobacteria bacterium]|nr:hemerythrin domain-containing protein [Deltaproteobacteria bacterium]